MEDATERLRSEKEDGIPRILIESSRTQFTDLIRKSSAYIRTFECGCALLLSVKSGGKIVAELIILKNTEFVYNFI